MLATLLLALAAPADPNEFIALGPGVTPIAGTLLKLADGTAELEALTGRKNVPDVYSLRRIGVPLPPHPRGPVLITTTGDRIPLDSRAEEPIAGDDQTLRVHPDFAKAEWEVPVANAAVVWLVKPPADTPLEPNRYSWLPANRNRDIVRLRNGDTASGTFTGFKASPAALRLKLETGDERLIPVSELAAIAFNPTLARGRRVKGPYARVVLRDGARFGLTQFAADAADLRGKSLFGQGVVVSLDEVVGLEVLQGKATYLADLKPKRVEQSAFLATAWPWTANQNIHGGALKLLEASGESTFDRGLGTHPRTVLTYDLAGKYKRFEALVGLDAESGSRGRAAVRILVDGKEQPLPSLARIAAGAAVPLSVSLSGAKELTLQIDFGPAGDVNADVNWADARLVE
jgi:hypothetical protein